MKVLVTGASGFIGSAVVADLLAAGHEVTGLARSEEAAKRVEATGAKVQRGDTEDLDSVRRAAAASDGVIHLAYNHDFSVSRDVAGRADAAAIAAMGEGLGASNKPLVNASGLLALRPGRLVSEADVPPAGWLRGQSEDVMLALAKRGVRTSIVRLPPTVHGPDDKGFMPMIIGVARQKGVSAYVGDGASRWPAVHRLDAARAFRLALERAPAGSRLHAVAEQGVPTRDIATSVGRRLGVPVASKPSGESDAHFGFLGHYFGMDTPAASDTTRKLLDWTPTHPGLLEDLESVY